MSKTATFLSFAALTFYLLLALVILHERRQLSERVELLERLADSGKVMIPLEHKMHSYSLFRLIQLFYMQLIPIALLTSSNFVFSPRSLAFLSLSTSCLAHTVLATAYATHN